MLSSMRTRDYWCKFKDLELWRWHWIIWVSPIKSNALLKFKTVEEWVRDVIWGFSPLLQALKWSEVLVAQSCLTLGDPMYCGPPGSSTHVIFQARVLEWVAISFSRGSSWPRGGTWVSCTAGRFFTYWAMREALVVGLKTRRKWRCKPRNASGP